MWAGGASSGTGIAKNVEALHGRAGSGDQPRHVQVHGFEALAVIDADGVAEDVEFLRKRDGASSDRANRFAFRSALVEAAVVLAGRFAVVEALDAEGRS